MIDGPHSCGFSPLAFPISLINAFESLRRVSSSSPSTKAETLWAVGRVLFSAMTFPPVKRRCRGDLCLDQPISYSDQRQFRLVAGAQLLLDVVQVRADRVWRQAQGLGNLVHRLPAGELDEH